MRLVLCGIEFRLVLMFLILLSPSVLAKSCESFYNEFRLSESFRLEYTKFPLKAIVLSCCDKEQVKKSSIIHLKDVLNNKIKIYPDYKILKKHDFVEILVQVNESECDLRIGPEESDVAISYKFRKERGKWSLIEFTDHWGA